MLDIKQMLESINPRKVLQAAVAVLALMLLVFVSAFVTLKVMTWGEIVEVPDIRGKELAEVVNELGALGLEVNVDRQEYHRSVSQGAVIYQSPLPYSEVKKGRGITVVVSLGSEEVKSPALKGEALKRAQILLQQAGLVLGDVYRIRASRPRNTVLAQYPEHDTVLQKGSRMEVLVCDGPVPVAFVTPDLSGKSIREAEEATRPMALRLVSGGRGSVIVSQNPLPGIQLAAGSPLYVTLGSR